MNDALRETRPAGDAAGQAGDEADSRPFPWAGYAAIVLAFGLGMLAMAWLVYVRHPRDAAGVLFLAFVVAGAMALAALWEGIGERRPRP